MKKTLALILAAMMVAGTASVAFANAPEVTIEQNSGKYYVWDKDASCFLPKSEDYVEYGDKIALELSGSDAQEKKEVTKNKVFPDWKVGANLVEDASIQYKKVETAAPGATYTATGKEYTIEYKTTKAPTSNSNFATGDVLKIVVTLDSESEFDKGQYDTKAAGLKNKLTGATITNKKDNKSVPSSEIDTADQDLIAKDLAKLHFKPSARKSEYKYMAVITLKDSTSTKVADLAGDIRVGKTLTAAKNDAEAGNKFELDLEVKHFSEEAGSSANDSITVVCDKYNENHVLEIEDDADVTDIEFGNGGELALFTVNLDGQSDVNVGYSTKFDADIAAKYPEANLEFIKWTASPVFNRTGDLYIYADEDTFLYEVTADGLKEVKKAEYDEDYGAHYLRTRKLGSYVVSDIELDLAASSEASSSGTSSSNPSTGGTTGTTTGNPGDKYNPNTGR